MAYYSSSMSSVLVYSLKFYVGSRLIQVVLVCCANERKQERS